MLFNFRCNSLYILLKIEKYKETKNTKKKRPNGYTKPLY